MMSPIELWFFNLNWLCSFDIFEGKYVAPKTRLEWHLKRLIQTLGFIPGSSFWVIMANRSQLIYTVTEDDYIEFASEAQIRLYNQNVPDELAITERSKSMSFIDGVLAKIGIISIIFTGGIVLWKRYK